MPRTTACCYFVNLLCASDRHCLSPSVVDSNTDSGSALCKDKDIGLV